METKILKIYTDGGAKDNPGPAAFGVVFKDENDNELFQHSERIGKATNNVAEYRGLLYALKNAKRYHPKKVELYLDSKLVVKQMQ
jgi:ribonuclease HI